MRKVTENINRILSLHGMPRTFFFFTCRQGFATRGLPILGLKSPYRDLTFKEKKKMKIV